nr:hypothetical protein [Candidatus Sigynarchaeota archaeon]
MDVAVSSIDITPGFDVQLYGYESRKNRTTRQVLDPIVLTGIAMREGDREFFILSFDLCLFDQAIAARIFAELQRLGIARDQVFISCTHTHCGPVCSYNPIFRGDPGSYISFLIPKLQQIVGELRDRYVPGCKTFYGEGATRVPKNRTNQHGITPTNPSGDIDHILNVLAIKTPGSEFLAVIFRISCHATLLTDIMKISADLPGSARKYLLEQLRQRETATQHVQPEILFLQGFCGDANPVQRGSMDLLESLGKRLASEVLVVIREKLVQVESVLRYHLDFLELACDATAETKKVAAVRKALKRGTTVLVDKIQWPIHVLQVAKRRLVIACGGEVVHEVADMVRGIFHDYSVVLVGYTGEYHTYIPTENHFRADSYEAFGVIKYTNLAGPLDHRDLNKRLIEKFTTLHEMVDTW